MWTKECLIDPSERTPAPDFGRGLSFSEWRTLVFSLHQERTVLFHQQMLLLHRSVEHRFIVDFERVQDSLVNGINAEFQVFEAERTRIRHVACDANAVPVGFVVGSRT